jgi:hypothetical protein
MFHALHMSYVSLAHDVYTNTHCHMSGATWVSITAGTSLSSTPFSSVAISASGARIFATSYIGYVHASFDSGASFVQLTTDLQGYSGVASNFFGSILLVVVYQGLMYQYT